MRAHPENRVHRVLPSLALAAALLLSPVSGRAADGVVIVHQSTFNELAAALGTLSASGRHVLKSWGVVICGKWEADVRDLQFAIRPTGVGITGRVSARYHCADTWISIPTPLTLTSSASVVYSESQNAILVTTSATSVRASLTIPGWVPVFGGDSVTLFTVNVGPTLSFSLPVRTANVDFETAAGPGWLRVVPRIRSLTLEQGQIRLQSDVALW